MGSDGEVIEEVEKAREEGSTGESMSEWTRRSERYEVLISRARSDMYR
jgi:hypothetical protein